MSMAGGFRPNNVMLQEGRIGYLNELDLITW